MDQGSFQKLKQDRALWLELFIAMNLAFLVLDIYVAHSFNSFAHWTEWIPFYFSLGGAALLLFALFREGNLRNGKLRALGFVLGWLAVVIGVGGLVLHLESNFFQALTLRALIYSAPFVAPLAFAGLGLLLIMNRMVDQSSILWGRWVIFLAFGGFCGNFLLSLADHAQNGFFFISEWIPVFSSALAVGYLLVLIFQPLNDVLYKYGIGVIGLQIVVGLIGAILHLFPHVDALTSGSFSRVIFGAPVFAPLLFVDLAVLSALGLWDLQKKATAV